MDEGRRLRARIAVLAGLWKNYHERTRAVRTRRAVLGHTGESFAFRVQDMKYGNNQTQSIQTLDLLPPPCYEDSLSDCPPDYTGTGALAAVQGLVDVKLDLGPQTAGPRESQRRSDDKVDWTSPAGIRYHAKKKKAAAKKPAWEEEEKKEEAPPDEGAGGDAGGGDGAGDAGDAGAGGDGGGDPPGDGGGDEPEDPWGAVGGKKNKKKKKKNAW